MPVARRNPNVSREWYKLVGAGSQTWCELLLLGTVGTGRPLMGQNVRVRCRLQAQAKGSDRSRSFT
jgi:hypothetical protein